MLFVIMGAFLGNNADPSLYLISFFGFIILVPIISKALAKRDYVDVQKKSKMFLLLSLLIAIPISVFMFVFSDNIIEILFPS